MTPRAATDREARRGNRVRFNFLADRRLRFVVHTIGLLIGTVVLVIFDLPPLFGFAFIGWWLAWTLQRESSDIYSELYEINDNLTRLVEERVPPHAAAPAEQSRG